MKWTYVFLGPPFRIKWRFVDVGLDKSYANVCLQLDRNC